MKRGLPGRRTRSRGIGEERRSDDYEGCPLLFARWVISYDCRCWGRSLWFVVVVRGGFVVGVFAGGAVWASRLAGTVWSHPAVVVCGGVAVHRVGGSGLFSGPQSGSRPRSDGGVCDVSG